MEKIKLFELFRGYGSQALALKKYGIEFENVGGCEIDKYADIAHKAIHGKVNNFGDITKLNTDDVPDHDLCTYSFPCQDISFAGKQKGLSKGSGTRSSLLWECERIIKAKKPKFLMMENVKALVGKKNLPDFKIWLSVLNSLGYNNYYKVINAKLCGVPQNRERVFCVSIRKDIDDGMFRFEDDFVTSVNLGDVLESKVDEKYYVNDEMTDGLIERAGKDGYINQNTQASKVMYPEKHFQTLCAGTHGYANGYVKVQGCAIRGRNPINPKSRKSGLPTVQMLEINKADNICNCLTTVQKDSLIIMAKSTGCRNSKESSKTIRVGGHNSLTKKHNWDHILDNEYRIRKLTPKECFRLMGVSDEDIYKIQSSGISNTQQYKLAGNSIVVNSMAFLKNL